MVWVFVLSLQIGEVRSWLIGFSAGIGSMWGYAPGYARRVCLGKATNCGANLLWSCGCHEPKKAEKRKTIYLKKKLYIFKILRLVSVNTFPLHILSKLVI